MQVLFVGHRTAGKSEIAARVAHLLGLPHVDLDQEIEARRGVACADLVRANEPEFRADEIETLTRVLGRDDVVISAGAGLEEIPPEPLVVWLHRDGWEESARTERARLRPDLEWQDEIEWMCATREPRWLDAAHLRIDVPRGRGPERVARDVATLLGWLTTPWSDVPGRTWVVPAAARELPRAARDATRFGFAGVEVRSDVLTPYPAIDAPALASVRTDDPDWIRAAVEHAIAIDLDLSHFDTFIAAGGFAATPRPLVLSTHPATIDPDDVTALAGAARRVQMEFGGWASQLSIKYAPRVQGFADIGLGRALVAPLRRAVGVTYLPQGFEHAWIRPLLAADNSTNYVAARLRATRAGLPDEGRTAWDLQDWLPHLVAPAPVVWDALIGDPVTRSQGDIWHRRSALEQGEAAGYVKVPVRADEFDAAISFLGELGIRGVSVTSPLKSRVKFVCPDDAHFGELLSDDAVWQAARAHAPVRTGNTLRRRGDRWLATDTDEAGMSESLRWFEDQGVGPATIALFGGGGVRDALMRAIERSDWFLVHRCHAREGWPDDKPPFVTLVVNAGGPGPGVHEGPPRSRAWLDLHYVDVGQPPADVLHLTGDVFFDAQAAAQRAFWRSG